MAPPSVRTTVVWCPDWPVVATGAPSDQPVGVVHGNRLIATSPPARAEGVRRGQRRREAQARCPDLVLFDHDPARDARTFEPVVAAIETVTPLIEVTRPGLCAFATRGPSRYHGGDAAMMALVEATAAAAFDPDDGRRIDVRVGTADGSFAAALAARRRDPAHRLIAVGGTPDFLAGLPISTLDAPELVDVLERLGIGTLGRFAALPRADVAARFGPSGDHAHRLASGLDPRPPDARPVPPNIEVATELDPPAERVDQAAFVAKALADRLHDRLDAVGLGCSMLTIAAETEHGERLERRWRHEGALSPGAIADRVRWQLDGWLSGSAVTRPTGGIARLALMPDEVRVASGRQLGFWGGQSAATERAARALARLQATLGPGAVVVPELRGGRDPSSQVVLVPVGAVDLTERRAVGTAGDSTGAVAPWPGRLPSPSPSTVMGEPVVVEVLDHHGRRVGVDGRGTPTAVPRQVVVGGTPAEVVAWAGPWPVDERWWDPGSRRRRARFQMVTDDGVARLLVLEGGSWWIAAIYD
ncbi:MAG: DNA polymerase Y family protein [Acidimicrobiales bacterium]